MEIYIVRPGDSVDRIAAAYQIPPDSIIYNNQLTYPYPLAIGQALLLSVPGSQPAPDVTLPFVYPGGYAYPFIDQWVLEQTLPYLSSLYVFSYGFTLEGTLVPPQIDDAPLIATAKAYGVAPILTLTPFDDSGQFNNHLISQAVNQEDIKQTLLDNLVTTVSAKGFEGVDIDFEYILPEDRIPFADFVRDVGNAMHTLGYPVSVALAPKTSDTQTGLLYEGKDYRLLGEAADYVLLMTYEWGYTYGPPLAVAPLNKVREVVEYALTKIPASKINLGIPNYGYDWPLPFVQGSSKATTIGNVEAVEIAIAQGVPIQYDETAQSPYFNYVKEGIAHEVWFEDVRSLSGKFGLVEEYGLRGMGYWQIMRLFRANWLLLADTFTIHPS